VGRVVVAWVRNEAYVARVRLPDRPSAGGGLQLLAVGKAIAVGVLICEMGRPGLGGRRVQEWVLHGIAMHRRRRHRRAAIREDMPRLMAATAVVDTAVRYLAGRGRASRNITAKQIGRADKHEQQHQAVMQERQNRGADETNS